MLYHFYYLLTMYAIFAIIISLIPALKKWHLPVFYTSLGILIGFGGGILGFFFGMNIPCVGEFCRLGMALLFCLIGFVGGMVLSIMLLRTLKVKKNTPQYWTFFAINMCINLAIIAVVDAMLRLDHIALFPALFYWYIPPY